MNSLDKNVPLPDERKPMQTKEESRKREPVHEAVHEVRAFETYDANDAHEVADTPWVHAASLEAPPPRPGFVQRWVRTMIGGEEDVTNLSRKFREGWRPRLASTVPAKYTPPRISAGRFVGCIGVEGMLLCERPEKLALKHRAAVQDKTNRVTAGMEAELQAQSHHAMPISQERRSQVVRNVSIQDD